MVRRTIVVRYDQNQSEYVNHESKLYFWSHYESFNLLMAWDRLWWLWRLVVVGLRTLLLLLVVGQMGQHSPLHQFVSQREIVTPGDFNFKIYHFHYIRSLGNFNLKIYQFHFLMSLEDFTFKIYHFHYSTRSSRDCDFKIYQFHYLRSLGDFTFKIYQFQYHSH